MIYTVITPYHLNSSSLEFSKFEKYIKKIKAATSIEQNPGTTVIEPHRLSWDRLVYMALNCPTICWQNENFILNFIPIGGLSDMVNLLVPVCVVGQRNYVCKMGCLAYPWKFCADWSMYSEAIATTCLMAINLLPWKSLTKLPQISHCENLKKLKPHRL